MRAKHHRRNAAKAATYAALEEQLRAALNGEVASVEEPAEAEFIPPPRKSPPHRVTALHTHKTTVRYSARESWGGHRFNLSYTKETISELEAKLAAESDMAKKRYIDVVHLETIHV